MSWKETTDINKFKKVAKQICEKDEAKYSLLYGIVLDDVFGKHLMLQNEESSIAIQTGPARPLVISDISDKKTARDLVDYLEANQSIKEIVGTKETINLILDQLRSSETGLPELIMDQKIYRLDNLKMPEIEYKMRQANPKDMALVTDWFYQFMLDAFVMNNPKKDQISKMAETRIENEEVFLLVKDGNPVSMACSNRPTLNGITLNGVFTPIEHRGNGFASQIVALLTEKLLTQYKFCSLYTDLNNPTSNKIYTSIGYKSVCDSLHFKIRS